MVDAYSDSIEQLKARDPLLWKILHNHDKCPDYGTPEHTALGGGQGPVYEPPRWMEDAIRKARERVKGIW